MQKICTLKFLETFAFCAYFSMSYMYTSITPRTDKKEEDIKFVKKLLIESKDTPSQFYSKELKFTVH